MCKHGRLKLIGRDMVSKIFSDVKKKLRIEIKTDLREARLPGKGGPNIMYTK